MKFGVTVRPYSRMEVLWCGRRKGQAERITNSRNRLVLLDDWRDKAVPCLLLRFIAPGSKRCL